MNEKDKITRRQVIGGLGATLAAAAVSPVFATSGNPEIRTIISTTRIARSNN